MKLRCFSSLVAATMVMVGTSGSEAAEIYNKDGNIIDVFGNFVGGHYFSKDKDCAGGQTFIRYGVLGKTSINDKMLGFGLWEHEISLNNVEGVSTYNNSKVLIGYAGINFGDLGSIDYGRNYGVLYDVLSWTDFTPAFNGDISFTDNFLSGRSSNVITYRNKNLFGFLNGLDFAVQYQGKNDINQVTGRTVKTANGEGYGVSASYSLNNGLATSAAYVNSKRVPDQKNLDGTYGSDTAEAYSVGIKYNKHGVYLAATYGETYNMTPFGNFDDVLSPDSLYGFVNKAKNLEVVAQYQFDCGLSPSISYLSAKATDIENGYGSYLKKCVTVGTNFMFNKNVSTTIDYRMNLLDKNDFTTAARISTDDVFSVGMSYLF